jgi:hypothetical protein
MAITPRIDDRGSRMLTRVHRLSIRRLMVWRAAASGELLVLSEPSP